MAWQASWHRYHRCSRLRVRLRYFCARLTQKIWSQGITYAVAIINRQLRMNDSESRAQSSGSIAMANPVSHRTRQVLGRGVVLHQLGHQPFASENIRQSDVGSIGFSLHQAIGRWRHAIGDYMRATQQCGLERCRATRHQRHIGCGQCQIGVAE